MTSIFTATERAAFRLGVLFAVAMMLGGVAAMCVARVVIVEVRR